MLEIILTILFAILPACPSEDAANCSWDGGNTGSSFVDVAGTAYYLNN